jgi:hypothetical protein
MARAAAQLDLIFEDRFTKLADPPPAENWLHGIWSGDQRGMYFVPARRQGKSQFVPAMHFAFRGLDPAEKL